jgi:hypothetical protein
MKTIPVTEKKMIELSCRHQNRQHLVPWKLIFATNFMAADAYVFLLSVGQLFS